MNKNVRLNQRLLTTSEFDSGALGLLASVIHQFSAGRYQAVVLRDGRKAGTTSFVVTESSANMQLNIDLASVAKPFSAADCACHEGGEAAPAVSPKGYVLFHVSGGSGAFAVVVGEEAEEGKAVFDSQKLADGDLFALSLLEPGPYSLANGEGKGKGEIQVTPIPAGTNPRTLAPVYVDAGKDGFDPAKVSVHSAQGLVFRVKGPARIVIQRQARVEAPVVAPEGKQVLRRASYRKLG